MVEKNAAPGRDAGQASGIVGQDSGAGSRASIGSKESLPLLFRVYTTGAEAKRAEAGGVRKRHEECCGYQLATAEHRLSAAALSDASGGRRRGPLTAGGMSSAARHRWRARGSPACASPAAAAPRQWQTGAGCRRPHRTRVSRRWLPGGAGMRPASAACLRHTSAAARALAAQSAAVGEGGRGGQGRVSRTQRQQGATAALSLAGPLWQPAAPPPNHAPAGQRRRTCSVNTPTNSQRPAGWLASAALADALADSQLSPCRSTAQYCRANMAACRPRSTLSLQQRRRGKMMAGERAQGRHGRWSASI